MDEAADKIAEGMRQGYRDAWTSLYDLYAERVWREAARLLGGNRQETADVVQEVFMAAAESACRFDAARGTLWNWLAGIVRNKVALRFRQNAAHISAAKRWWNRMNDMSRQWLAGRRDAPDGALEAKEMATLVRCTLLKISHEYQTLLVGKYIEDLSAAELASRCGSTAGAIRARLLRARQAFRKAFQAGARADEPEPARSKP